MLKIFEDDCLFNVTNGVVTVLNVVNGINLKIVQLSSGVLQTTVYKI